MCRGAWAPIFESGTPHSRGAFEFGGGVGGSFAPLPLVARAVVGLDIGLAGWCRDHATSASRLAIGGLA